MNLNTNSDEYQSVQERKIMINLNIHSIIDGIWNDILFFLNGFDFISINQTCQYFYKLTNDSSIRNSKYHNQVKKHVAIITRNQYTKIEQMSLVIDNELSDARIQLEAACQLLQRITKTQLDELRYYGSPPPRLMLMTFEAAFILLKKRHRGWKEIRIYVRDNSFISNLIQLDAVTVPEKCRKLLEKKYFSNHEFTYERVNQISKACAPIVQWIKAQVRLSHLLDSVEPMALELKQYKHQYNQNKQKYFAK